MEAAESGHAGKRSFDLMMLTPISLQSVLTGPAQKLHTVSSNI